LGEPFELVLVNDGSRARSPGEMRALYARGSRVVVVDFSRNVGHQAAIWAG
jgi:dolichol-phosphate mannosyltransferase